MQFAQQLDDELSQSEKQSVLATRAGTKARTTFTQYSEAWLKRRGDLKPSTRSSYQSILDQRLIPFFGDMNLQAITRETIQDFVTDMVDDGLGAYTIRHILAELHQILDDALWNKYLQENPYKKIRRPPCDKVERDYLRLHEIPLFLKNTEPKTHALFYTGIFTGMRRGELGGLQWSCVDWVNSQAHVKRSLYQRNPQTPKTKNSVRVIDIGPDLVQVLREHRARQNAKKLKSRGEWNKLDLVFCQDNGKPLDMDHIYHRDFRRVLKKAGLRGMPMHGLRHTYAALVIAAGHNPKYLQHQMGHGSVQITLDLYGHLYDEANREAAKKTEAFYKTESKKAVKKIAEAEKVAVEMENGDGYSEVCHRPSQTATKASQSQKNRVSFSSLTP
jgi:integrase